MLNHFWMQKKAAASFVTPTLYVAKNRTECCMVSTDEGDNWTTIGPEPDLVWAPTQKVHRFGNRIYVTLQENYGAAFTDNGGTDWTLGWNANNYDIGYNGTYWYSCAPWGVWRDEDGSDPGWTQITGDDCRCFNYSGSYLYIGSTSGVKVYDGANWSNNGPSYLINEILVINSTTLWATLQGGGVAKSTNNGTSWTTYTTSNGLLTNNCFGITYDSANSRVIVGCDDVSGTRGLAYTDNAGSNWSTWDIGIGAATRICPRHYSGRIYVTGYGGSSGMAISSNNGSSWSQKSVGANTNVYWLHLHS